MIEKNKKMFRLSGLFGFVFLVSIGFISPTLTDAYPFQTVIENPINFVLKVVNFFKSPYAKDFNSTPLPVVEQKNNLIVENNIDEKITQSTSTIYVKKEVDPIKQIPTVLNVTYAGVSPFELNTRLSQFESNLKTELINLSQQQNSRQSASIQSVYNVVSQTNRIDQLNNTVINNPTINGGSINSMSFSGSFSGSVNASTLSVGGEMSVEKFTATSTTATSTFAGGLSVAGDSGLTVLQNGYVGIGTTAPAGLLNIAATGGLAANPNFFIDTYSSTNNARGQLNFRKSKSDTLGALSQTVDGELLGAIHAWGVTSNNGFNDDPVQIRFIQDGDSGVSRVPGRIEFGTSNGVGGAGTRMTIKASGNVGIGTTTPSEKLEVNGSIRISPGSNGNFIFSDGSIMSSANMGSASSISNATDVVVLGDSDINGTGSLIFKTGNSEKMRVTNTGFVGIGTNSPSANLTFGTNSTINSLGSLTINSATVNALTLDSGTTGVINIGTNANAKTITIGNSTGATALTLNSGTGAINIGTNSIAHTVTIGNSTGATSVLLNSGTGVINIGANPVAHTVTVGNITGATAVNINTGTGNFALNANQFFVNKTSGNIGIGNVVPTTKLDVTGTINATGLTINGVPVNTSSDSYWSAGTGGINYGAGNVGIGTSSPSQALDLGAVSANLIFSDTTGVHQILTGGATDMALMPGGNVGIGTTTPAYKLDVTGTINATGLTINGVPVNTSSDSYWGLATGGVNYGLGNVGTGTTSPWGKLSVNPDGISGPSFVVGSSTRTHFMVTNRGDVNIGLTNSTYSTDSSSTLAVAGAIAVDANSQNSWAGSNGSSNGSVLNGIFFGAPSMYNTGESIMSKRTAGGNYAGLDFITGYNSRLSITNSGNVGIGTTTPVYPLEISSVTGAVFRMKNSGSNDPEIILDGNRSGANSDLGYVYGSWNGTTVGAIGFKTGPDNTQKDDGHIVLSTGNNGVMAERLRVTYDGNVGIGTISPAYKLDVAGVVNATSLTINGVPVNTSSDSHWASTTGGIYYNVGNIGIGTVSPTGNLAITQTASTTGALKGIVYTGAVNTNQTLSTEIPSLTLTTTGRQWATGALATQREVLITQPTYSFVGASTITNAATVGIAGAPIKSTNATITNTHGLLIQAGNVSTAANSYGLTVNAQTGATANYSAAFLGGNVGIGTAAPLGRLGVVGNMAVGATYGALNPPTNGAIIEGNVGIGTALPGASLHVFKGSPGGVITPSTTAGIAIENSNDVSLQMFSPTDKSGSVQFGSSINGSQGRINYQHSPTATTDYMSFDVMATERLRIDINGRVGIGTITPSQVLDLGAVSANLIFSDTTGVHQILTGGATDLALMPGGNVGIGTTTPMYKLDVVGQINATGLKINGVDVATSNDTYWSSATGGINYSAGNVGIGTITPAGLLDVNGKLTVLSSGKVGIGTTTPLSTLDVNGGVAVGSYAGVDVAPANGLIVSGNVGIGVTNPASPLDVNGDIRIHAGSGGRLVFADGSVLSSANTGSADALSNASDTVIIGDSDADSSGDIIFKIGSLETMRISNSAVLTFSSNFFGSSINWGTGLGAINHILGPSDNALTINSAAANALTMDSGTTGAINIGTNANAKTITIGNATGATALTLNSGTGAINIGTNAIAKTITIGNGTGATSVVLNSGTGAISIGTNAIAHTVTLGNTTGATAVNINTGTGNFALNTNQFFVNKTSGNIGVGTTSPSSKLSITQSANTFTGGLWLAETGNTDFRSTYMDTSGVMSFYGGDTAGTLNTATLNAAGAWTNASDISYKENIVDLNTVYGLQTVLSIQPRYYKMKGMEMKQIGFVAQELEKFVPEVVDGEDGKKGVSYGNLTALTVSAIQDISKILNIASTTEGALSSIRLETIEERLTILESQNSNNSTLSILNFDSVLESLKNLGVKISNGLTQFKKVIVEALTVGSPSQPAGITLFSPNGQAYCLSVSDDGTPKSIKGECNDLITSSTTESILIESNTASTTSNLSIILLGNNPAEVPLNSTYIDLGAMASTSDGTQLMPDMVENNVDTSKVGQYFVTWRAYNSQMIFASTTRMVNVFDPYPISQSTTTLDVATSTEEVIVDQQNL